MKKWCAPVFHGARLGARFLQLKLKRLRLRRRPGVATVTANTTGGAHKIISCAPPGCYPGAVLPLPDGRALYRRAPAHDHEDQRKNNTDYRANPGEIYRGAGDPAETQYRGDQCDDEKRNGPRDHVCLLLI